ncbi:MAG: mechanosensitive ion channel family protein, partial [Acidobacteria bacterium]|nr:mechanosensitive ion channel family protein [Acidobacteriota bacterium]
SGMAGVLADPAPTALIEELGDSSVLIRFYGWVDQREAGFYKVKSEAIRQIKTVLEDAGMDLPEPIYRVHLVETTKAPAARLEKKAPEPAASSPDIQPEDALDRQIAEDRAETGSSGDLLDTAAPTE